MTTKNKKYIAIVSIIFLIGSFFVFNDSFQDTVSRRRKIKKIQEELIKIDQESKNIRDKILTLKSNPIAKEDLVRQDLGYLKPGEKEVRFITTKKK